MHYSRASSRDLLFVVLINGASIINWYIQLIEFPQANQEGRFLDNNWVFNDLHMNALNNFSYTGNEILILGDSVIWGGNRLDQKERIGKLINDLSRKKNIKKHR